MIANDLPDWFRRAVELAASEQVYQWDTKEKQSYEACAAEPDLDTLRSFLGYLRVARNVPLSERPRFLQFAKCAVQQSPDFRTTPKKLLEYEQKGKTTHPLSALSKWVVVRYTKSGWTPYDRYASASILEISSQGMKRFDEYYKRLNNSAWVGVCKELDGASGCRYGHSIARVFDKFLFLAGAERVGKRTWETFPANGSRLSPEQRERARRLAQSILENERAPRLLLDLLCVPAREALGTAYEAREQGPAAS